MDVWGWFQIVRNFWLEKISQFSQNRLKCLISKGILQIYLRFPKISRLRRAPCVIDYYLGPTGQKYSSLIRSRKGAKGVYLRGILLMGNDYDGSPVIEGCQSSLQYSKIPCLKFLELKFKNNEILNCKFSWCKIFKIEDCAGYGVPEQRETHPGALPEGPYHRHVLWLSFSRTVSMSSLWRFALSSKSGFAGKLSEIFSKLNQSTRIAAGRGRRFGN